MDESNASAVGVPSLHPRKSNAWSGSRTTVGSGVGSGVAVGVAVGSGVG